MNVKKVGNVILAVKDIKKSVDFYKIKNIVSTETLIELEVDMGW